MTSGLIGQRLGKYRILSRLGRGGMADVYKGYQDGLDRNVAIKVIHEHMTEDDAFIERFRREAQSVAQLRHPHILQVIDFDVHEGTYFMVMEYIRGGNLKEYIVENGPSNPEYALTIIAQIADALDYAHQKGMIHRDIKPANIMFTDTAHQQAVLTDFGIAKIIDASVLTSSGMLVGTPLYMSPESGLGHAADPRSDIYGLGIVLYEMLTGEVPFRAETPYAIIMKHISEPLPMRDLDQRDLPEVVKRVLMRATEKDPDERYATAADFSQALRAARDEIAATAGTRVAAERRHATTQQPRKTQPVPQSAQPQRQTARPLVPLLAAFIGLLLVLFGVVWMMQRDAGGFSQAAPVLPTSAALPTEVAALAEPTAAGPLQEPAPPTNLPPPVPRTANERLLRDFGGGFPQNFLAEDAALAQQVRESVNDPQALYAIAQLALERGEGRIVPPLMARAIRLDPQPQYHTLMGWAHLEQENVPAAIESFGEAIALDPTYGDAYQGRARAHELAENYRAADADYRAAIDLNPDEAKLHYARANVQSQLRPTPHDSIIRNLERAIALDGAQADYHQALGIAFLETGDSESAIAAFSNAIDLAPDDPDKYVQRAVAHAEASDPEAALDDLQTARDLGYEPDAAAYALAAASAYQLANFALAADLYGEAIALDPENPTLYVRLAEALVGDERAAAALEVIAEAKDRGVDGVGLYVVEAEILLDMGDEQAARAVYARVREDVDLGEDDDMQARLDAIAQQLGE